MKLSDADIRVIGRLTEEGLAVNEKDRTDTDTPEEQLPKRQRPQRKRRWLLIVAVAVALAAFGATGWIYYTTVEAQRVAVAWLDEATELVEAADSVILDLDEVVRAEIDVEVGERAAAVSDAVPGAIADLTRAIELIAQAREDLPEGDIPYALALRDSATARLEMLEGAEPILEANRKAAASLGPSAKAWDLLVQAEELSRQSSVEFGKLTRPSVTRSTALATEASAKIGQARALFSEAATGFPEVDFSQYDVYCERKLAALALSKQADAAWLAGRIAEANEISARYNQVEQELGALAERLPSAPAVLIAEGYERLAAEITQTYFSARARATAADARLREITGQREPAPEGGPQ